MEIEMTDLGEASRIVLQGRLDTRGVDQIEPRFTSSIVPPGRDAVVDLSRVTFLSSMGIRMLITAAHALGLKHARLVLFGAQPLVRETLEHASIDALIPVVASEADALARLKAA